MLSNYPLGFSDGLSVRGVPILNAHAGKVFWVSSVVGGDGAKGTSSEKPFATLNKAISMCRANKGDIIFLMPGHVEDIEDTSTSGAIDLDVAGISVIGLGNGPDQPRFDFNDADSDFIIGASGITIQNVHFSATVTGVVLGVAIEAAITDSMIKGCRFSVETTTTDEFLITINLLAGCDRTIINSCYMDSGLGGAVHAIKLVGASADCIISNNTIKGDYSTANIGGITTLSTELLIDNNLLINGSSGNIGTEPVIEVLTGTTGVVKDNTFFCNLATIAAQTVADTMIFSRNFAGEDVGAAAGNILRTEAVSVTGSADD